jgi:hypothetical protein
MNRLYRFQPQDACKFHDAIGSAYSVLTALPHLPYRADISNAPTVDTTNTDPKNLNEINERISLNFAGRSPPPLNVLGGGQYRFAGAQFGRRSQLIAAAIDAEAGVPAADPITSQDGVRAFRIPRRASR